jgi:hypothetical protein
MTILWSFDEKHPYPDDDFVLSWRCQRHRILRAAGLESQILFDAQGQELYGFEVDDVFVAVVL